MGHWSNNAMGSMNRSPVDHDDLGDHYDHDDHDDHDDHADHLVHDAHCCVDLSELEVGGYLTRCTLARRSL